LDCTTLFAPAEWIRTIAASMSGNEVSRLLVEYANQYLETRDDANANLARPILTDRELARQEVFPFLEWMKKPQV
jgi:hypothetical protein